MKALLPALLLATAAVGIPSAPPPVAIARQRLAVAVRDERAQAGRIAAARASLAEMVAVLVRLVRRPPALALAGGASLTEVTHRRLLIAGLQDSIARQEAVLAREVARGGERHAATLISQGLLQASTRGDSAGVAGPPPAESQLAPPTSVVPHDRTVSDRLADLPGPSLSPDAPPAPRARRGRALYRLPATGDILIGTGERTPDGGQARGLTMATAPDRPVVAPAAGRIRYAGPFRNYGDIVIIDHGHGWTSLIAGLAQSSAELGESVRIGAPIGRTGRRLLAELRHNGRPVDIVAVATALERGSPADSR